MIRLTFTILLLVPVSFFALLKYQQEDITYDVTWTKSDSPVYIYGNVTIKNNATLTIRAGVEVRFMPVNGDGGFREGSELYIADGKLVAYGTQTSPVIFTSGKNMKSKGDWGCIVVEGDNIINMNHCVIEYAKAGLIFWNLSQSANMITSVNYCIVQNCSEVGMLFYNSSPNINYNSIKYNYYGIQTQNWSSPIVNNNDIFDNNIYNLRNISRSNVDATSNWWGTTNKDKIALKIYDYYDDHNYGVVDYQPFRETSFFNEGGVGDNSVGWLRAMFIP
ncbi:MAG: hypothetical protein ACUVWP_09460 [bacterium]